MDFLFFLLNGSFYVYIMLYIVQHRTKGYLFRFVDGVTQIDVNILFPSWRQEKEAHCAVNLLTDRTQFIISFKC